MKQARNYTRAEVEALADIAAKTSTDDAARQAGMLPKTLRSVFIRHCVSVRALKRERQAEEARPAFGLFRIPATTPAVIYGKAAVEVLAASNGCSWPIGDPAERDFHFCGGRKVFGKSYCAEHLEQSRPERKTKTPAEARV